MRKIRIYGGKWYINGKQMNGSENLTDEEIELMKNIGDKYAARKEREAKAARRAIESVNRAKERLQRERMEA